MIKTQLTKEDALEVLKLGKALHKESRYQSSPFNDDKVLHLFGLTLRYPEKFFMAFDDEYKGFILMSIQEDYFSDTKYAADFCLYIKPEYRGSLLVKRLVGSAEKWAKEHGAYEVRLGHTTGIKTDTAPRLFNKLGYEPTGYLFKKGIQ